MQYHLFYWILFIIQSKVYLWTLYVLYTIDHRLKKQYIHDVRVISNAVNSYLHASINLCKQEVIHAWNDENQQAVKITDSFLLYSFTMLDPKDKNTINWKYFLYSFHIYTLNVIEMDSIPIFNVNLVLHISALFQMKNNVEIWCKKCISYKFTNDNSGSYPLNTPTKPFIHISYDNLHGKSIFFSHLSETCGQSCTQMTRQNKFSYSWSDGMEIFRAVS